MFTGQDPKSRTFLFLYPYPFAHSGCLYTSWPRYVFLYVTLDSMSFLLDQSSGPALEAFDDLTPDWLGSLRRSDDPKGPSGAK